MEITVKRALREWPGGDTWAEQAPHNELLALINKNNLGPDDVIWVENPNSGLNPLFTMLPDWEYRYQIRDGLLYVSVSEGNVLEWPERPDGDSDWYAPASKCPYPYQNALKASRRRLEDHIRKNPALLVECIQIAEKHGYPV